METRGEKLVVKCDDKYIVLFYRPDKEHLKEIDEIRDITAFYNNIIPNTMYILMYAEHYLHPIRFYWTTVKDIWRHGCHGPKYTIKRAVNNIKEFITKIKREKEESYTQNKVLST